MTTVDGVSTVYDPETTAILAAKNASHGKSASAGNGKGAQAKVKDVVSISQAAKGKNTAAATGDDAEGSAAVSGSTDAPQYKNQTKAIKAALQQLAEETGVPMRGWAIGHYRQAFAAAEGGDLAAMRGIYLSRHGVTETPAAPGTDIDPGTDLEPGVDLEPGTDQEPGTGLEAGTGTETGPAADADGGVIPVVEDDEETVPDLTADGDPGHIPDLEELLYENTAQG